MRQFTKDEDESIEKFYVPTLGGELQFHFKLYSFETPVGDLAFPKFIAASVYWPKTGNTFNHKAGAVFAFKFGVAFSGGI